jgi:hypothetical protein
MLTKDFQYIFDYSYYQNSKLSILLNFLSIRTVGFALLQVL